MQSLVFGLCIITSVYYSLRKWDHLQMNCLFMGSKTIYNLLQLPLRMLELSLLQFDDVIFIFPANRTQTNKLTYLPDTLVYLCVTKFLL